MLTDDQREALADAARTAAPVFAAKNWKWGTPGGGSVVPDAIVIYERLLVMAERALDKGAIVRTGRLRVSPEDTFGDPALVVDLELVDFDGGADAD